MDLSGTWRAAEADEELRRTSAEPDFDDGGWEPIAVPGHWRSNGAFSASDGPLLYRTRFEGPDAIGGRRHWLVLDGVFYQGDVSIDGDYLGVTEGYFFPHAFEITDAVAARREHVLAVEVACPPQRDRTAKRSLTGVFQHWDCLDPEWNPGGLWRPVRVESTGAVRIRSLRAVCRDASTVRAVVAVRAVLDTLEARTVTLRTTLGEHEVVAEHPLAAGENRVEWTITCTDPRLWWPRALGAQPLYDLVVEAATADTEGPSDRRSLRVGLRTVQLRNWIASVNGERLYLKGSNLGPTRMALGEATRDELERDVQLAVDAGLDLVRVHAHVTRPEFYDATDRAGLLVWQDLPLQWGYARGIRKQATRQAREAVDLLAHHPSVAIWCAHNEPMAIDLEPGVVPSGARAVGLFSRALAAQELPTWNKTVLDRSLKRALEKADGTRPVIAHSGVLPHPPQLDGTDSHLYFGWYWGDERQFPQLCAAMPRLARFVTEFGAQAVPDDAAFCRPDEWPDLDWERLAHRHALQKQPFDRYVPPASYPTFEAWRDATQRYQAQVVKHHIETLRRLKYHPSGGFAHFFFADAMPR